MIAHKYGAGNEGKTSACSVSFADKLRDALRPKFPYIDEATDEEVEEFTEKLIADAFSGAYWKESSRSVTDKSSNPVSKGHSAATPPENTVQGNVERRKVPLTLTWAQFQALEPKLLRIAQTLNYADRRSHG